MQAKNDRVKQMEKEVAVVDELHSVVKMLREDLAGERQKCTELELAVHDSQNTAEDLQRQLTMARKNVDKLKQNNFDLTNEIEKLRESQGSGSFISNSSFNQTMVQELEMKV
jgi:chromosome segregation ATPase